MKEIKFNYKEGSDICNREDKKIGHWGCCCECANHYEVFKHCMYNEKEPGKENECICKESLGFFVCIIPEEIQGGRQMASISGKHSVCEMFLPRKNNSALDYESYLKKIKEIEDECKYAIEDLTEKYIGDNAKFKIGDFIGNVCGIIKIEKISSQFFSGELEILYKGLRYKKVKGELLRTKDCKLAYFIENRSKLIQTNTELTPLCGEK